MYITFFSAKTTKVKIHTHFVSINYFDLFYEYISIWLLISVHMSYRFYSTDISPVHSRWKIQSNNSSTKPDVDWFIEPPSRKIILAIFLSTSLISGHIRTTIKTRRMFYYVMRSLLIFSESWLSSSMVKKYYLYKHCFVWP